MIPKTVENSLLSTGKNSNANYLSIFDKDKVNIYYSNAKVISVSK